MRNSWNGFKELILVDKINECEGITSFYFKAKDGSKLLIHQPGQFLPFKLKTDDPKYKDVIRTYSLSNYPNEHVYRISVKKVEGGLISTFLHEKLNVGDSIEAMIPTGLFTIENHSKSEPLILLSGGIGVTPLLSMLYAEASTRDHIHFVQAVQNSSLHPFKKDIAALAETHGIKNTVFYSDPLDTDVEGRDYDQKGYITKEWLKENVPLNGSFYFCGPPIFMKILEGSLLELGVPKEKIHFELFS